jgi:hypothetical protein
MDEKPSLWSFARAFREHWFAAMSGGFSVPFTALAVFLDNKYAQAIFGALAFLGAWFAAYTAWRSERQKRLALEEQLARRARLTVKPPIQFDPNGPTEFYIDLEIWNPAHPTIFRNWMLTVSREKENLLVIAPRDVYGGRVLPNVLTGIERDDLSKIPVESGAHREARCRPECGWNSVWRILR